MEPALPADEAVATAEAMLESAIKGNVDPYNLFNWNCECAARACKTQRRDSLQAVAAIDKFVVACENSRVFNHLTN
jgi:hypothetical protein